MTADHAKSLSSSFGRVARRVAGVALLSLIMLTPLRVNRDNEKSIPKTQDIENTQTGDTAINGANWQQTGDIENDINKQLLYDAKLNIHDIIATTPDTYTTYLDSLENALNAQLKATDGTKFSNVSIISPMHIDFALALNIDHRMIVKYELHQDKADVARNLIDTISAAMARDYSTRYGTGIYTQRPGTVIDTRRHDPQTSVIIPAGYDAIPEQWNMPGFSHQETRNLINGHEGFHAIENRYTLDDIAASDFKIINLADPKAMVNDSIGLRYVSLMLKREGVADIAAIGEMVRSGAKDVSSIRTFATVRDSCGGDMDHMTGDILRGFARDVETIGIAAFKAMTPKQAIDFYYTSVEKYAMQPEDFRQMYSYMTADSLQRAQMQANPALAKAVDFKNAVDACHNLQNKQTPPSPEIEAQLKNWNPQKLLIERAYKLSRVVTPTSMIKAYAQMQSELYDKTRTDPDNHIYAEKMSRLKKTLVEKLSTTDFVKINAGYGIKPDKLLGMAQ